MVSSMSISMARGRWVIVSRPFCFQRCRPRQATVELPRISDPPHGVQFRETTSPGRGCRATSKIRSIALVLLALFLFVLLVFFFVVFLFVIRIVLGEVK